MKALVYTQYGAPETVLKIEDIPVPKPKHNEVLVKIMTTSINDYDWAVVTGKPYLYRLMFGLFKPKKKVPGMELSGIVVEKGQAISNFNIGDRVYGDISAHTFGSFAEYICIPSEAVQKMPENIKHEEAVALPHASLLALQAFDKVRLRQGQKVLINGGGGGVGAIAVQLAKLKDCTVTGVDSGEKLNTMLSFGFDEVLDYKKINFTKQHIKYDVILDCKTSQSVLAYKNALEPSGKYVSIGGKLTSLISLLILGGLLSKVTSKKYQILSLKPNKGLEQIEELCAQKKLKFLIDGPYPFEELPRLIQYFGEARHFGKIVVKIEQELKF